MSAQDIQAQIDIISQDIEQQKQVLKKLEWDRSLLQCQLNAVRDPITRLPLEIASEIFVHCLPPYPNPYTGRFLLNICNAWTRIAQSTPALWTTIYFAPGADGFEKLLGKWFQYAGNHPLNVHASGTLDSAVTETILRHSHHLARLELSSGTQNDVYEEDETLDVELLGGVLPEPLPVLRALAIRGAENTRFWSFPFLQLLRLSPNLTELELKDIEFVMEPEATGVHVLSNLCRLSVNIFNGRGIRTILGRISAPRLECLDLYGLGMHDNDPLTSFLRRSSPPLQKLHIVNVQNSRTVDEILSLLPTTTHVEFEYFGQRVAQDLFTQVLEQPTMLPNLQSLHCALMPSDLPWDAIPGVLSARRARIQSVRLECNAISIPADCLNALRDLSAGGMHICIGNKTRTIFPDNT
ncbi:hypothetical protein FB45DRAFT_900830 [Roridomyces roridus]|uniref:F-box domain-containing protein n=1 Tax=Roridomyces roridus TaxID=1738132 RepID=A0AAD7FVQ6_9AGAR|nr:hypothetical protein FB45DRAFT_900830 [Roridomyces roridus]